MDGEVEIQEQTVETAVVPEKAAAHTISEAEQVSIKEVRKRALSLALPSVVELLLVSMFGIVDMILVGHISPAAIAAVGLTNQPMFLMLAVFQALNVGTTAVVARSIGAKKIDDACEATRQTMIITWVLGLVVSLTGIAFAEPIIRWMGAEPEVLPLGTRYFQIVAGGLIFQTTSMGLSAVLRGAGDTRTPMVFNIVANVVNVTGNILLINGYLGFPRLLVAGSAWATSFSRLVACAMALYVVYSGKFIIKLKGRDRFRLRPDLIGRIIRVGVPAAIEQFVMRAGMIAFTRVVSGLGTIVFAAHQVSINIVSLSFTPGQGFGMAATTLVGQNLGAKDPEMAQRASTETRKMGNMVATFMGLIFFFFGGWIGRLYTSDPQVAAYVATALKIIAFVQPLQSTQFILAGALRGAGDTKWPLVSTTIGVCGVRVVLAYLFVLGMHWGLIGAWLAMACDQLMRSMVIEWRYKSGRWKRVSV